MSLLLASAVPVTIVIGFGLLCAWLLRRRSAALRHWILAASVMAASAVPALEAIVPGWTVSWPTWTSVGAAAAVDTQPDLETLAVVAVPGSGEASPAALASSIDWIAIGVALWIAGAAVGLMVLLAGVLRLRQYARDGHVVGDAQWKALLDEARGVLGVRRRVRLLITTHHGLAATWGGRAPTVLLPASAAGWSVERKRLVLLHEIAHVQRGDWRVQMIAAVLCRVYWFNPLLWLAGRRLRQEGERACDDVVLQRGVAGAEYATHLVALARELGGARVALAAAPAVAHRSTMEERIQAMLLENVNRRPVRRVVRVLTAALLIACAGLIASASPFRLGTATVRTVNTPAHDAAQAASLAGTLYDQHSGVLPDVAVALTPATGGESLTARTSAEGSFEFRDLAAGDYTLVSRLPGFAPVTNMIRLAPGAQVQRNIMMPLGTVQEGVTVTSDGTEAPSPDQPARWRARDLPAPQVPSPCVGRIGGCVKPPTKVLDKKPIYPQALAAAGVTGQVRLTARIGIDGYVNDLRAVEPRAGEVAPHPDLVAAAIEAVRQWEFNPTYLNGAPVEANIDILVQFNRP